MSSSSLLEIFSAESECKTGFQSVAEFFFLLFSYYIVVTMIPDSDN